MKNKKGILLAVLAAVWVMGLSAQQEMDIDAAIQQASKDITSVPAMLGARVALVNFNAPKDASEYVLAGLYRVLAGNNKLPVIAKADADRALANQKLSATGAATDQQAVAVAKALNATYAFTGSMEKVGNGWRFSGKVLSALDGKQAATTSINIKESAQLTKLMGGTATTTVVATPATQPAPTSIPVATPKPAATPAPKPTPVAPVVAKPATPAGRPPQSAFYGEWNAGSTLYVISETSFQKGPHSFNTINSWTPIENTGYYSGRAAPKWTKEQFPYGYKVNLTILGNTFDEWFCLSADGKTILWMFDGLDMSHADELKPGAPPARVMPPVADLNPKVTLPQSSFYGDWNTNYTPLNISATTFKYLNTENYTITNWQPIGNPLTSGNYSKEKYPYGYKITRTLNGTTSELYMCLSLDGNRFIISGKDDFIPVRDVYDKGPAPVPTVVTSKPATGEGLLFVTSVKGKRGGEATVTLHLQHPGLAGFQIGVSYDSKRLKLESPDKVVRINGDYGPYTVNLVGLQMLGCTKPVDSNYQRNPFTVIWAGVQNSYTQGDILKITFRIPADAPLGEAKVNVDIVSSITELRAPVKTTVIAGYITVE